MFPFVQFTVDEIAKYNAEYAKKNVVNHQIKHMNSLTI